MVHKKALLVEDQPIPQKIAKLVLEHLGFSVSIAKTGHETLKLFVPGRYDFVFLDVSLPDLNGISLSRILRKIDAGEPKTPLIALSAHDEETAVKFYGPSSLNGFLSKPLTIQTVLTLISQWGGSR